MHPVSTIHRRHFVGLTAAAAAGLAHSASAQAPAAPPAGPFKLDPLPYPQDALEPAIDAVTMGIHHGKHHQTYVNNLNTAVSGQPSFRSKTLEELIGNIPLLPPDTQKAIQNNGGGHWNHRLFWQLMGKPASASSGPPAGGLAKAIDKSFKSLAQFKEKFSDAALKRFGSGWAWLIANDDGALSVVSTPNQDNPLMQGIVPNSDRGAPLLALDVWEHAYYLKYQNKRKDYIDAWWSVVNWEKVSDLYAAATAEKKEK